MWLWIHLIVQCMQLRCLTSCCGGECSSVHPIESTVCVRLRSTTAASSNRFVRGQPDTEALEEASCQKVVGDWAAQISDT